jgi:outer membrane protein OmpA-like peptidoglycan-associated protein
MSTFAVRRAPPPDAGGESADKAFWISFADMMTALMVLFLMVMAVALLAITQPQREPEPQPTPAKLEQAVTPEVQAPVTPEPAQPQKLADPQQQAIEKLMAQIAQAVEGTPGVQLDARRHVIDFGDRARFVTGSHRLDAEGARLLRSFVPQLLAITQTDLGKRWVHRVVVEGFADPRGDYLYNLNLSLQRGQRVLCTLLAAGDDGTALDDAQRAEVREIFAVGGFSFNDPRESLDASRRIELRIEFGPRPAGNPSSRDTPVGACRLGAGA